MRTTPTLGNAHLNRTQAWWSSARNAIVGIVSLIACSNVPPAEPRIVGEGTPIFFIGNSLTYVNDVPGMLQALADSAGGERLAVASLALPRTRAGVTMRVDPAVARILQDAAASVTLGASGR